MDTSKQSYLSPLSTRYASREMQYLFSADYKFITWRKLWLSLAKAEQKLGLPITDQQIAEMTAALTDINYPVAQQREKEVRHDVMAHVYAFGQQCPTAAPIIHLGATSCYVGDNTDLIIMREAATLLRQKLIMVIKNLAAFADQYQALPCLAYTHLQPAQLTTVGKRATLWMWELFMDEQEISNRLSKLQFLGSKGATGTQASFCQLFAGNREKIRLLEQYIATDMGFNAIAPVSGQTYSRKVDANMLATLSGIAQSAHKFANDIRLLQSFEEIEEPFETQQIGSSAMPYKRNPMRAERITALARYVISDSLNPAFTAANQWFERTLDDSANKRIAVAEAFLAVDAILDLYINISAGLVVYPGVIAKRVGEKLPFMATENILMQAVQKGGDRQQLHEKLRQHTHAAAYAVKTQGSPNDLLQRIAADPAFALDQGELSQLLNPADYIGLAQVQTSEFLTQIVQPLLDQYPQIDIHPQLQV